MEGVSAFPGSSLVASYHKASSHGPIKNAQGNPVIRAEVGKDWSIQGYRKGLTESWPHRDINYMVSVNNDSNLLTQVSFPTEPNKNQSLIRQLVIE